MSDSLVQKTMSRIRRFKMKDNDLFIVTFPSPLSYDKKKDMFKSLSTMSKQYRIGFILVDSKDPIDFKKVGEKEMNKLGWYRK